MNKKPSKANLFRFVTLRNPQLVDESTNTIGFVFHPDTTQSNFITVAETSDEASKKLNLKAAHTAYTAFQNKSEIRNQNQSLYDFSSWLMRTKNVLSYASIYDNKKTAVELTETQELLIWENLLYQAFENTATHVRNALIQVLVANQFLKAFETFRAGSTEEITFTEDQVEEFVRRANAVVVIPRVLTQLESIKSNGIHRKPLNKEEAKRDNTVKRVLLEREVENYKQVRSEIDKIETLYDKENKRAFKEALDLFNKRVDDVIADNPNKGEPEGDTPATDRSADLVAMDRETFTFTPVDPTGAYLTTRLSDKALGFMTSQKLVEELPLYDTLGEVNEAIGRRIQERKQEIGTLTPLSPQPKNIRIAGNVVPLETRAEAQDGDYDYNFIPLHEQTNDGTRNIILQIFDHVTGSNITGADYSIYFPQTEDSFQSVSFEILNDGDFLTIALFPEGIVFPEGATYYYLEGSLEVIGGEFNIDRNIYVNRATYGYFDEVTPQPSTTLPDKKVFGLTSLGIADFRRVEQEILCYVPGEVSHIENILAREYKERSTRSLTSLQTETETTSEREVENLTDTTTTERSELQTEVSAVINEDESQNYGATANFSYSPKATGVSFNLGAYADFSSSTSTSNSNSQAQSYAQEVTERALERVVQKVSTRRTSIMLREFEENNVHGFDNTLGDQHITGVYRWVDKIYKNQLVNYGKRLIYEFTVPEPSRFFKEAIKKRLEDGDTNTNDMVEPIPPVTLESQNINSPVDLDAENYQDAAALYNAEVNAYLAPLLRIGKSFSHKFFGEEAQGHDSFNRNAKDYEMELPEGYRCSAVDIRGNIIREGNGGTASAAIYIGDNKFSFGTTSSWKDIEYDNAPLNNLITGVLPISIATEDVEPINFNIVAHCYLNSEPKQQWQNETYNAIKTAYQERLAEYKDAKAIFDAPVTETTEDVRFNPLFNRSLEQKELKRLCIELMAEQCDLNFAQDHYQGMNPETCVSPVNASQALQTHAETVRFFEQVFDWDLMAYTLYPYFYAAKKDWVKLFQQRNGSDPLFQAFLQAGMARVVLPIRPGFEAAANWYLETGELWTGQGMTTDNETYLSIMEDLQSVPGEVESTWETRVPTSLTIVQAKSAILDEGGLPCFDPKGELENTILESEQTLKGATGTETPPEEGGGEATF
ncbi:hypothetical protein [uncultured Dokdonia sp.]|uniref:hypothetical protein n=1 Tax=uncultured Dokdonia sp. TaxID=575653 RepID=UPI0026331861|nr:hypothetical protein [uncultured Dokdonia sp.]